MLFEETMLEKGEYQKFVMFRILKSLEGANYTISDIAEEMNISYQQTYNILQELLDDVQSFPNTELQSLSRKKLFNNKKIPISVDMYRLFLLKRSIVFQFIDYVVQGMNPNVEKFCQDHYISRSTLLRKNSGLKALLERYDIKISYNDLKFVGDEKQIRFFLYCFYWLSYRGIEWPFNSIRYFDVSQKLLLEKNELNDPVITIRTVIFWSISRIRILHGYYVSRIDRFDEIFPNEERLHQTDSIFNTDNFPTVSVQQLHMEAQFFLFFRMQSLVYSNSNDKLSNLIYDEVSRTKGPVWELTQDFMGSLKKYLVDNKEAERITMDKTLNANIMRIFFSYYIMHGDYLQFNNFYDSGEAISYDNSVPYKVINIFISKKIEDPAFRPYVIAEDKVISEMQYLMIPYLSYFKYNEAVKVKLVLESSDLITRDLITFLRDLSFIEIESDSDEPENSDVIISSIEDLEEIYQGKNLDGKVIVNWNLDATESEYFGLYQTLKEVFTQKISI